MNYQEYKVKVYLNGDVFWRNKEDQRHREDGPAKEFASGTKSWYINGKRHRKDGPAVEYASGSKQWFIRGVHYTEEEFNQKISLISYEEKEIEIDGVTYILKEKS